MATEPEIVMSEYFRNHRTRRDTQTAATEKSQYSCAARAAKREQRPVAAASRERSAEAVSTTPRQIRLSALAGVDPPPALFCLSKAGWLLVPLLIQPKAVSSLRYDNVIDLH